MEDNQFDYNGTNEEQQAQEQAELEAQEEQEAEEQALAEQEEQQTFEEQILQANVEKRLNIIDTKIKTRSCPVLSSQDKEILAQAKQMPSKKVRATTMEYKRKVKIGQFFLKVMQTIAPILPYILIGLGVLLLALAIAAAIDAIFASIFGGGAGGGTGGGMNSQFGATGNDFYAVRLVYEDNEQAGKYIVNDYAMILYDAVDNVQGTEQYQVTVNLTLPEDRTTDYDDSTADEKIKNVINTLVEKVYIYDNPDYVSQGIDLATLTLSQKAQGIRYFGLNTDLIDIFKNEIISNFLLVNFNQADGILTYSPIGEVEIDDETVKTNIQSALDTYFAGLTTIRSEKYFVRDCLLEGDKMLEDVEQKNYVAMMYLPRKNVSIPSLSIYTYGADPTQLSIEYNGRTFTEFEEWPVDDGISMYTYSLGSLTSSAVVGYDTSTAVTTATAIYKLVDSPNADNYIAVGTDNICTYKDFGTVIKFHSTQPFSFIDEIE